MGCITSKLLLTADDLDGEITTHHVVSLTSSTYGVLSLDREEDEKKEEEEEEEKETSTTKVTAKKPPLPFSTPLSKQKRKASREFLPEIINTWELMKDLSPAVKPVTPELAGTPGKPRRRLYGKENNNNNSPNSPREIPNRILRPFSSSANSSPREAPSRIPKPFSSLKSKNPPTPIDVKTRRLDRDWGAIGSKRSLSPLFDPELVASFERELRKDSNFLDSFEAKCPPGGENAVVMYTTTLRGIRKTYEDCNAVRNAVGAHEVRAVEKDVSMDSGFREEMRVLVGPRRPPPLLFVKGRFIGGAEEVLKLEEEGKLGSILEGMPKKEVASCRVCGGVRFVMCRKCNGSCKVLDDKEGKMVKCGDCNENGLIHCPNSTC